VNAAVASRHGGIPENPGSQEIEEIATVAKEAQRNVKPSTNLRMVAMDPDQNEWVKLRERAAKIRESERELAELSQNPVERAAKLQRELTEQAPLYHVAAAAATPPEPVAGSDDIKVKAEAAFQLPVAPGDAWAPPVPVATVAAPTAAVSTVEAPTVNVGQPRLQNASPPLQIARNEDKHEDKHEDSLRKAKAKKPSENSEVPSAIMMHSVSKFAGADMRDVRPNAGKGPDTVSFGLFAKTFYGFDLKGKEFTIDVVQTYKWMDERVIGLVPDGADHLTLGQKEAEDKIWLPGMVITNREIDQYDLISTAVTINKKGEVSKVERATAIVKCKYDLSDFPFDEQKLIVKVASSKYMTDEVMLKPDSGAFGAEKGLLVGQVYDLLDVGGTAITDVSGALKKSRGLLTISVERNLDKYSQSHLIPCFLMTCVSCAVFWFPFIAPFITPRLAMSVLALVQFTYLTIRSSSNLPATCPYNWNDLINQTILTVMFSSIMLNIFGETVFHTLKLGDLAISMNHECKVLQPFVAVTSVGAILALAGPHSWMSIAATSAFIKIYMALVLGSYIAFSIRRVKIASAKKLSGEDLKDVSKPDMTPIKPVAPPDVTPVVSSTPK